MSDKDKATEGLHKDPTNPRDILDGTGALVATTWPYPVTAKTIERAALIVRAVNSHEPLCKALERAWDMLNQARAVARLQGCNALNGPEVADVIENARAALATAKETP